METGVSRGRKEYKNMRHLNQNERIKIEHFLNMKYSIRSIAKMLNVSPSTISREIRRNQKDIRANTYGIYEYCKHRKNCTLLHTSTAKQCSTDCPKYELETCTLFDKKNSSHKDEIRVSENTIRNYISKGLFQADVFDTIHPRFVSKTSKKRRSI